MRFRTLILFMLLLSQPLAAFNLNCGMPMHDAAAGAAVSDGHCGGHVSARNDAVTGHEQAPDQHPASHAVTDGHCQLCASGVFLLPLVPPGEAAPLFLSALQRVADHAPQFQSGPLFRPPIH